MGVPAMFRWLSQKYPKIVSTVQEELPKKVGDAVIPVDRTGPNPNGEEFDNLYLDMNGIVHPCSHPEDKPAPKTEADMMLAIFEYTDRVLGMVRPRKLLYMAVDGVAPRAKMNQQRSRRFRSAKEAKEKDEERAEFQKILNSQKASRGEDITSLEQVVEKTWDSNAITPGTPFMHLLAESLQYWCAYKFTTDPSWKDMKVIISDASVPGEGEHKIMNFIRSQRAMPTHDPNTSHVIYGLDADLIMLSLATHEPYFRVLREDVFYDSGKDKVCTRCGRKGHIRTNCEFPDDGKRLRKNGLRQSTSSSLSSGCTPTSCESIWLSKWTRPSAPSSMTLSAHWMIGSSCVSSLVTISCHTCLVLKFATRVSTYSLASGEISPLKWMTM